MAVVARRSAASSRTRQRVLDRHQAVYRQRVDRYFEGMYRRIAPSVAEVAREVSTKADPGLTSEVYAKLGRISWDQETRILSSSVTPVTIATVASAFELAGDEVGVGVNFDLSNRPVRSILGSVGTRIQQVTDTSRTRVARLVADGIEKGLSVEQIVRGVPPGRTNVRGPIPEFIGLRGLVDSWRSTGKPGFRGPGVDASSRSYLIALTETGNAFNQASIAAYASSGVVDYVEVFDGPECGWSSHDDPELAHGSIRSLEDARRQPLAHPHCQRSFGARVDAEAARPSPYTRPGAVPGATPGVGAVDPLDAAAVRLSGAGGPIPSRAVAEASQRTWERAREAERAITESISKVVGGRSVSFDDALAGADAAPGGDLAGLANRRKTLTSLSRKIDLKVQEAALENPPRIITPAQAAAEIGDTVRYTYRFGEQEYWAGVRRASQELVDGGNRPIGWKPTWDSPIYRGLNTSWRAPNGTIFEVQFHTPTSFVTKELNHVQYGEARLVTTSAARRAVLDAEMAARTANVPIPPGKWMTLEEATALRVTGARPFVSIGEELDLFLDPAVGRTRLAREEAIDRLRSTGKGNAELMRAEEDFLRAYEAARDRIRARAAALSPEEARDALAELQRSIDDLRIEVQVATSRVGGILSDLGGTERREVGFLVQALDELEAAANLVRARLPLRERVLPPPELTPVSAQTVEVHGAFLRILEDLEAELELPSRWTGRVQIGGVDRDAAAHFAWDGTVALDRTVLAGDALGWRIHVLTHEALHSLSPGLTPAQYVGRRGWEEGVVEMATAVVENRARVAAGLPKLPYPRPQTYAQYTGPLERMRVALEGIGVVDARLDAFYLRLVQTPSIQRPGVVDDMVAETVRDIRARGLPEYRVEALERIRAELQIALDV